jgi:radical SAM protein with 4Fe4S-binding SPASM domain
MSLLNKLDKRRLLLLWRAVRRTRINADLWRYTVNRIKVLTENHERNTCINHPTNVMLELGNVCTLHCDTCPREHEYGKDMDIGFMPYDKATRVIDQLMPYLDSIGLTGLGETFLYPHLLDILKYIKQRKPNVVVTLSTNANFKGYLSKVKPLLPYIDNLQFSVDGISGVYSSIRHCDFATLKENIKQTVEWGQGDTVFMFNCVVNENNMNHLLPIVEFADETGVGYVNFNLMSIVGMPNRPRSYYGLFQSEEFLKSRTELLDAAKQFPKVRVSGLSYPQNPSFHDCIYPWEYPYITWDGYYVPCCGKPFPKVLNFGNVFDTDDIMSVLNSEKARQFRQLWQKNKAPKFCHNCQLTNI